MPASPHPLHKDRLKVAFAIKISEMIVKADGVIQPSEKEFLEEAFPAEMLAALGLEDPAEYETLRNLALDELPDLLDREEKLMLVGLFLAVCESDSEIDVRELEVLALAADQLGLPFEDVIGYLDGIAPKGDAPPDMDQAPTT